MQNSVKQIAKAYAELSDRREDKLRFNEQGFIDFAKANKDLYRIVETDDDLLVGTWHCNELLEDYRNTLKVEKIQATFGTINSDAKISLDDTRRKNLYD
jgi:hypothetical protein